MKTHSSLLMVPMTAGIFLFLLFPVLHGAASSLWYQVDGVLQWTGLAGYRFALQDRGFRYSLVITVLWSTLTVAGTVSAGFHIAVHMAEHPRSRSFLFLMLFVPWVMPVYIAAPLWRAIVHGNGGSSLITAITGYAVPIMDSPAAGFFTALAVSIWMHLPVTVFVLYGHIRKIPADIFAASEIDGCSRWKRIPGIYMPLLYQPLMVLVFLTAISSFSDFSLLYLLTGGGPPMLSGITDRYVIGGTTTLGIFLYQVFQGVHHYHVTASVGVLTACITALLLILWKTASMEDPAARTRSLRLICAAAHVLPLGRFHLVFALIFMLSLKNRRRFLIAASLELFVMLYLLFSVGVLEGLNPMIITTLTALAAGVLQGRDILQGEKFHAAVHIVLVLAGMLLLVSSAVLVLFMVFYLSLSGADIASVTGFIPPFASAGAYRNVFMNPSVWRSIANSFIIAAGTSLILLLMIIPASAYLSDRSSKVRNRWISGTHVVSVSGGMHTLIPLIFVLSPLGLLDTRFAVMAVYAAGTIAPALMVLLGYLQGLPVSLKEAARLEGATLLQWLRYVLIPVSLPAISLCALLGFMKGYNGFLVPLVLMRSEKLYPVSLRIYGFAGDAAGARAQWSSFAVLSLLHLAMAAAVLWKTREPLGKTALREITE